jgi:hypothetical protein
MNPSRFVFPFSLFLMGCGMAAAQGTSFTHQGHLNCGGIPAGGNRAHDPFCGESRQSLARLLFSIHISVSYCVLHLTLELPRNAGLIRMGEIGKGLILLGIVF